MKQTRRTRAGFTLMELLVVVAIIVIATAMAMPSIAKFMRGQKLQHAGRMLQSVFNDARRAAITQRAKQYVFIGRYRSAANLAGTDVYALHIYREGLGWEPGEPTKLPAAVKPVFVNETSTPLVIKGCSLIVQDWTDGLPPGDGSAGSGFDTTTNPFDGTKKVKTSIPCHELRKDGTIACRYGCTPTSLSKPDLFDLNIPPLTDGTYSRSNFMTTPFADICLEQVGDMSKLCFVTIDQNTGRVRFRQVEAENIGN